MLLELLGWFGIGKCRYREQCGPQTLPYDTEEDITGARNYCLTFVHCICPTFQAKQREEQVRSRTVRSLCEDQY